MADEACSPEASDIDRAWQHFSSADRTQASKPGLRPGPQLGHLQDTPEMVATGRAWQGPALTKRANSIDKNRTNSSSPASPDLADPYGRKPASAA
jgi:hypothetical protein